MPERLASRLAAAVALAAAVVLVFIGMPSVVAVLISSRAPEWTLPGALLAFFVAAGLTVIGGRAVRPVPITTRFVLALAVVVWCAQTAGALLGWVLATHLPSDRLSSPAAWLGPFVGIAPLLSVWAIWEPFRRAWQRREERSPTPNALPQDLAHDPHDQ
jgi:hypothetical protein